MLITFSGLDGAGKSTLIQELKTALEKKNQQVTVLTMYGHVGLYAFIRFLRDWSRQETKMQAKGNDFFIEAHQPRVYVDKQGWPMKNFLRVLRSNTVKQFVYIFDLCTFVLYRIYFEKIRKDILIMDRYFYDSLADIAKRRNWSYIKLFLLITPTPDLPIFVDVTPEQAYHRKGEYSVNYMVWRQCMYKKIFGLVPHSLILANDNLNVTLPTLNTVVSERIGRL